MTTSLPELNFREQKVNNRYHFIYLLVVIFATILLYNFTKNNLEMLVDSFYYLSTAEHIKNGDGFYYNLKNNPLPLTAFPPIYPLAISFPFDEIKDNAICLNMFLFAMNSLLIYYLIFKETNSQISAFISGIIYITSPTATVMYTWVMSDTLFLFFTLLGMIFITKYLDNYNFKWLIFTAITLSLITLTRYVGIVQIVVFSVFLLYKKTKIKHLISFTIVLLIPILLWAIRNTLLTGNPVKRTLVFHFNYAKLTELFLCIRNWILPIDLRLRYAIFFILIFLISYAILEVYYRKNKSSNTVSNTLYIFYIVLYLIGVFVAGSTTDIFTSFDQRMMAPVFVLFLILFDSRLHFFFTTYPIKNYHKFGLLFFIISSLIINGYNTSLFLGLFGEKHYFLFW